MVENGCKDKWKGGLLQKPANCVMLTTGHFYTCHLSAVLLNMSSEYFVLELKD